MSTSAIDIIKRVYNDGAHGVPYDEDKFVKMLNLIGIAEIAECMRMEEEFKKQGTEK